MENQITNELIKCAMDWSTILTIIAAAASTVGLIYTFLRNFKTDINSHIDKLEKRMNNFESRMNSIDERIFLLATGKNLSQAILEEKIKEEKAKEKKGE